MGKIIRGTLDNKNRVVLKQPDGGTGRLRCPKCQGLAITMTHPQTGQTTMQCQGCGSFITAKPF